VHDLVVKLSRVTGSGWCRWPGTISLGVVLAVACGRSERNGHTPGMNADAGDAGGPASSGGRSGSVGGSSGAVQNLAGESTVAGESTSAGGESGDENAVGGANVGGASVGGQAGDGGQLTPTPICDDGNSCTRDAFVDGACHHDAAANATPCDDGKLCTLGDQCSAGVCVAGMLQTGAGHALGKVETYGIDLTVTPGGNRFAFVDAFSSPARVTLGEVANGVLQQKDQLELDHSVGFSLIATAWDDLIAVADGDTSFGLNGPSRNLQLLSIEPDGSLTPHAIVPITPGSTTNPANASMVGRGSRLFLCHNWSFFSAPAGTLMWWDVSDPDVPVLIAQGSTKGQCGSVAASEDGTRVYVNTVNGVLWTDLSSWTTGDLTFAADPLVAMDAGVHVRGDRLVARSGELLRVFDESDHTLLASFTVPGAHTAALTDAGIFVESDVAVGDGTENSVGLYDVSGLLLEKRVVSSFDFKRDLVSTKPVANESYAMDTTTHRLFSVSADGFEEVDEPEVGAMNQVFAGTGSVHARGSLTAYRVDVSDPTAPVILAGGPTRDTAVGIKLDVSLAPANLVPETDPTARFFSGPDPAIVAVDPFRGHTTQTLIRTVTADANEHLTDGVAFQLPGGAAILQSAGDFVYRAAYVAGSGFHFQRWQVADLIAGVTAPVMDLVFEAGTAATPAFDVDPRARVAVFATPGTAADPLSGKIRWIDLATEPPTVTETPAASASSVRIQGDQLVYAQPISTGSTLHFRQRGNDTDATFDVPSRITRLLGFDGTTVYFANETSLSAVTHKPSAAPTLTLDLPMRSAPSSLVAMPGSLVAASAAQLVTFAPVCD
jgi:hypothetical protein